MRCTSYGMTPCGYPPGVREDLRTEAGVPAGSGAYAHLLGQTQVWKGPSATSTLISAFLAQVLGQTQGWTWAATGWVAQVLGHTHGWTDAAGAEMGLSVLRLAIRISSIMRTLYRAGLPSPYESGQNRYLIAIIEPGH